MRIVSIRPTDLALPNRRARMTLDFRLGGGLLRPLRGEFLGSFYVSID